MRDYAILSIETHLFFARIMKEHALFLEAGFPCCEKEWIEEAEHFRRKFEELLQNTLEIAEGNIQEPVLNSNELITEFTIPAEKRTEALSGIPIDIETSKLTRKLRCGCSREENRSLNQKVMRINERAIRMLKEFIRFKERILCKMNSGQLYTANYPLLIEHITREARLYHDILENLMGNRNISYQSLYETEAFWNQIMMEHAWFIRGLLDPSEAQLIETADDFSKDYARLLETARRQDCRATSHSECPDTPPCKTHQDSRMSPDRLTEKTLAQTLRYRDFKAAGAQGILDCKISSIILPLLADHVLREANHYIRILETRRTR